MNERNSSEIPSGLRVWFVIHFFADVMVGIPLLFVPGLFLPLLGWDVVDPVSSRLVGAALMGIGIESLLGRNAGVEAFRGMLNLKVIWAVSAVIGISLAFFHGAPVSAWGILAIFVVFGGVWVYYRMKLRKNPGRGE
ncbi:MAG: hypothetical protein GF401_16920 [Chitinivibrionales bacterium]|nr:hypothetical protein [Chitinivibrionales bacterium]